MQHCPDRLWHNPAAQSLLVLIPGTTGLGFPEKRGFGYIASVLWAAGMSVYLANISGQDGRIGELDMSEWVRETARDTTSLMAAHSFHTLDFFGSCLGGPVAAKCAAYFPRSRLFLWETAPVYTADHRADFVPYSTSQKVPLAQNFWNTLLELESNVSPATSVTCYYGSRLKMPFTADDLARLKRSFPSWRFQEVRGADHGMPRGSTPELLPLFCSDLIAGLRETL